MDRHINRAEAGDCMFGSLSEFISFICWRTSKNEG